MTDTIVTPDTTYALIRPIGVGGMGQVLLVQSPRQPKPVALKFLQPQWMTEPRIEAFKREFALLKDLHHPHLCGAYDFGFASSHQQYFFTSEFIEGEQLNLALGNAPIEEVEQVIVQILSALDFLHSIGLVHFDVKGENVLITRGKMGQPNATLVDLGVTSPANKPLTEIAGTLHYIAPELLLPDPTADARCDLYSFGVMCYRLLAGQLPYTFQTFDDVWQWHRNHPTLDLEPLRQHGVPDYLCQMIARCMRPSPSERFSRASVVLNFIALHSGKTQSQVRLLQRAQIAEGPFVGRGSLMATIKNTLKAAKWSGSLIRSSQGNNQRAFLLTGRDGMGKTRFVQELKYVAQLADFAVKIIDGQQQGASWDVFCKAVDCADSEATTEVVQQHLLAKATKHPLCLCCDNLHLATSKVQQCIYGLMGVLFSTALTQEAPPLLCIATAVPGQYPATVADTMIVEMAPLQRGDVEEYLRQLVGEPEDFGPYANAVWDFSSGLPLLMVEAARAYHQDQALPLSIEELYDEQIAGLTPGARALLQLLAFANRPMPFAVIERILQTTITADIATLMQAALVRHDSAGDTYALSTGALAAVMQADLASDVRKKFAEPLIAWVATLPNHTALDAAPYAADAADWARTDQLLSHAAQLAETSGNATQAIAFLATVAALRYAHERAEDGMATERKMATLQLYQGRYDECEQTLKKITTRSGAAQPDDLKLLGLLCRVRRKPRDAIAHYEAALRIVPNDPTDPAYLFLENERGQAYLEAGDVAAAIKILETTYAQATTLPPEKQEKVTNNNLGAALGLSGRLAEAIQLYREKLQCFAHDRRLQSSIYSQLATTQMRAGKLDDAIESFEAAWTIANTTGDLHNAKIILDNLIALLQKKAAYSRALTYAKKSLALKSVGSSDQDMGRTMMTLATLYVNLGVLDLAARHLIQAMRVVRRCRDAQLRGWIHISFGYLYKDLGRFMEALNAFEETIFIGEEHQDMELVRWGRYGAADVCIDFGSLEEANHSMHQLASMTEGVTDEEFLTRYAILTHRMRVMREPTPTTDIAADLETIAAQCETAGWLELQWEVEHLLGLLYQKRREFDPIKQHLRKAATIIETLAAGLGEEYRDSFLKQRVRARVFAELAAAEKNEIYVSQMTAGQSVNRPAVQGTEAVPVKPQATTVTPREQSERRPRKKVQR